MVSLPGERQASPFFRQQTPTSQMAPEQQSVVCWQVSPGCPHAGAHLPSTQLAWPQHSPFTDPVQVPCGGTQQMPDWLGGLMSQPPEQQSPVLVQIAPNTRQHVEVWQAVSSHWHSSSGQQSVGESHVSLGPMHSAKQTPFTQNPVQHSWSLAHSESALAQHLLSLQLPEQQPAPS